MIKASGAIFIAAKTKRVCLFLRSKTVSKPGLWGFAGGKIESQENLLRGLSRELREEIGSVPKYLKTHLIDVYKSIDDGFMYYTFIVIVKDEFIPKINHESSGYGWFNLDNFPKPLHPGARTIMMASDFVDFTDKMIEDAKKKK